MAISYVSGAAAAAASVAMPAHQAGDMIVVYAFRNGNTTAPTIAAGFIGLNPVGANACSFTVGFKVATSGSETSGTWTNATSVAVAVYRNASTETWTTPVAYTQSGTGTSINYAVSGASFFGARYTLPQANTQVWHLRAAGHTAATDLASATPSGWTARVAGAQTRIMDSNGPSSTLPDSIGGNTQTVNASSGWTSVSVRLEAWDGTGIVCMGADSTSGTSADLMPWHKAGDAIIGFSARANNTPPSLPSGYTNLGSGGANTHSAIIAYKVAASSSESNPVFANGTNTLVMVYRSSRGSFDSLDVGNTNQGLSTTVDWANTSVSPATNQTTKFIRFATFNGTGFMAIPANWTSRADWGTPNPGIEAIDADGTKKAEDIGGNTSTLGASMAWQTMTARLSYRPYDYENVNVFNEPVPADAVGCYVTLIGGGGGGGGASGGAFAARGGGGGGGGGGMIWRSFIPKSKLGATYILARGDGGSPTSDGGNSVFMSGSVTIAAMGGKGGTDGATTGSAAAGVGGTVTLSGISGVAAINGTDGGAGGDGPTPSVGAAAAANTAGGAPGGGGGGGRSGGGTSRAGGLGGNSLYATGGAAGGSANSPGSPGGNGGTGQPGGGGGGGWSSNSSNGINASVGGAGGTYGAGGGGAGGGNYYAAGGTGGPGYARIEWVTVAQEENLTVSNVPVPENVTGCYVTMTGAGGGGGGGATRGGTGSGNGGGGGGGGAHVKRAWVPVSALGPTYSVTQGLGGAAVTQGNVGSPGGDSVFSSGSTTIIAGGGSGGATASSPTGGAGGTVSLGSFTAEIVEDGASGGNASTAQGVAGSPGGNSVYAGAGGGGGGSNKSSAAGGGDGGSSATVAGAARGSTAGAGGANAADAALGFGGAGGGGGSGNSGFGTNAGGGGTGGLTGGGGGGGGGKEGATGTAGPGRPGGNGYTLVEWVATDPSQFFAAYGFF